LLKSDNEKLLKEAREERDKILRDARTASNRLQEEAQATAKKTADKIIEDAKSVINTEKQAALRDVKAQVAQFSLEIAEKLIRKTSLTISRRRINRIINQRPQAN